jgi:hypothetical protein
MLWHHYSYISQVVGLSQLSHLWYHYHTLSISYVWYLLEHKYLSDVIRMLAKPLIIKGNSGKAAGGN